MIEPKSVQKFDELVENSSIEDFFLSGTIVLVALVNMLEFSVVESVVRVTTRILEGAFA